MIYYVLTGGEWVHNYETASSDIPFETSYFIKFKTQPTIEKLKSIFIDLYIQDKRVNWNDDVNNKDAVMVQSIVRSKSKIEEVSIWVD